MKIAEQQHGAVTVIRPTGPLCGPDAQEVKLRLLAAFKSTRGRFVIDASEIAFVDGAALEMLLDVTDAMNRTGQTLKLCGANETISQVMELTGLTPQFEFFSDANAAVRSFL